MKKNGSFIVSLDFEMMWGMVDCETKDGYGQTNVKQVPQVVDRMLEMFDQYGVHATFGTVGMMMYNNPEELLNELPDVKPTYKQKELSPYENNYIREIKVSEQDLFFCPNLIERINKHKGMEIGSHTYCHYYCWAAGQTVEQFDVDVAKAVEVASRNGIALKSIIFPRNNVSEEHLKVVAKHGIECYRGNALKFFQEPKNKFHEMIIRACRLLDTYINIGGNTSYPYEDIDFSESPLNVRASRMLRPYYKKLAWLEPFHMRRIKGEIIHAAKHGEVYHLWWHPHNLGADMEKNFEMLDTILRTYAECHEKYGMNSYNMAEMTELLRNK